MFTIESPNLNVMQKVLCDSCDNVQWCYFEAVFDKYEVLCAL